MQSNNDMCALLKEHKSSSKESAEIIIVEKKKNETLTIEISNMEEQLLKALSHSKSDK